MITIYDYIENSKYTNYDDLYDELIKIYDNNDVNFVIYDLFSYEYNCKRINRDQQAEFRIENDPLECEVAHIKPLYEKYDYSIDNSLLLTSSIHKTFDNYLWSINPDTMKIECKYPDKKLTINNYNNKKINIENISQKLKDNLNIHYQKFLNNN